MRKNVFISLIIFCFSTQASDKNVIVSHEIDRNVIFPFLSSYSGLEPISRLKQTCKDFRDAMDAKWVINSAGYKRLTTDHTQADRVLFCGGVARYYFPYPDRLYIDTVFTDLWNQDFVRRNEAICRTQKTESTTYWGDFDKMPPQDMMHLLVGEKEVKEPTPIFFALHQNLIKSVEILLSYDKKSINYVSENQNRILHEAAPAWINPKIFRLAVQAGADVNAINEHGMTALHIICDDASSNKDMLMTDILSKINMLLQARADVSIVDNQGKTPLHYIGKASGCDNPFDKSCEKAMPLLDAGIDLNAKDLKKGTALLYACKGNKYWESGDESHKMLKNISFIRLLIEKGADVNIGDSNGWTPLHAMCSYAPCYDPYYETIEMLLKKGADLDAIAYVKEKNSLIQTPITPRQMLQEKAKHDPVNRQKSISLIESWDKNWDENKDCRKQDNKPLIQPQQEVAPKRSNFYYTAAIIFISAILYHLHT